MPSPTEAIKINNNRHVIAKLMLKALHTLKWHIVKRRFLKWQKEEIITFPALKTRGN